MERHRGIFLEWYDLVNDKESIQYEKMVLRTDVCDRGEGPFGEGTDRG